MRNGDLCAASLNHRPSALAVERHRGWPCYRAAKRAKKQLAGGNLPPPAPSSARVAGKAIYQRMPPPETFSLPHGLSLPNRPSSDVTGRGVT